MPRGLAKEEGNASHSIKEEGDFCPETGMLSDEGCLMSEPES